MKFIITRSAFVDGKYYVADARNPLVIELPDNAAPDHISRTWKPADKKAQAALAKLGVKASVATVDAVAEQAEAPAAPGAPALTAPQQTAGEI